MQAFRQPVSDTGTRLIGDSARRFLARSSEWQPDGGVHNVRLGSIIITPMVVPVSRVGLWLAAVTACLALVSGCAASEGTANHPSSASDCGSGTPDPISASTLIRVFAKHGFAVRRIDGCADPKA